MSILEVIVPTGEIIEREPSQQELAQRAKDIATEQAKITEAEAKAEAKATAFAKLAVLGLEPDDLKALGL